MKKAVKGIIGLTAVLAVLGGGLAALMLTQPDDEIEPEDSVSEPEQDIKILIRDDTVTGTDPDTGADLEGVVKQVSVKNSTDEFLVVRAKSSDSDNVTYTIDGYEDIAMKTSMIGTLANNANGLTSEATIEENCTDIAKFGLDSPKAEVEVEYESGTKCRMIIGGEAPTGNVNYVMIDGLDTVFTVRSSALANYSNTVMDFVSTTILEAPETYPIVKSLRIQRENLDTDILLEYDEMSDDENYKGGTSASHIMVEPARAYLAVERSTDITTGMFGLSAEGIYSVHCNDADIAEAGLENPFCTVTMECNDGNTYTLLLSEPFTYEDSGRCSYAMLEGGSVIYIVKEENAKWTDIEPVDIASRIFMATYVWNVENLKVTAGGKEYAFDVKRINPDEEIESLKSEHFRATLNGSEFSSERYRLFYSFLISANAEDFALGEEIPAGGPMASIEYRDTYAGEDVKLEFYEQTSMTALIVINGESRFHIAKSFVDTLTANAEKLETDEDFVTTWK